MRPSYPENDSIRINIVGMWTDMRVGWLCYALRVRYCLGRTVVVEGYISD